jgi:mRNA interferase MazF
LSRGDVVLVAARDRYSGKPRPAVVVQSDLFTPTHGSVTLCLITSELREAPLFRIDVSPSPDNGLRKKSQVMVDKVFSAPRESVRDTVGALDPPTMSRVADALRLWLDL